MENFRSNGNAPTISSMDTIQSKTVDWLWYPYIPYGKITIVQGDPGEGKTTFVLRLAAMLSKGNCFTVNAQLDEVESINVIYQTAEDGLADTVKPRLEEANADCSKILVIDDSEKALSLDDVRIEAAIKQTGAKLIIFDPIQAYLGVNTDMNRANDARELTKRLGGIAERTGCAVVLIGHMNKGSGIKAAYRGIGSVDFFAVARSVLLIGKVSTDKSIRAICQIKNNLAPEGESVAFSLDEDGFTWLGKYEITQEELLNGFSVGTKKSKAVTFLEELFETCDSIPTNEAYAQGMARGFSKRTLENAKQELELTSMRVGTGWHWVKKDFKNATSQSV